MSDAATEEDSTSLDLPGASPELSTPRDPFSGRPEIEAARRVVVKIGSRVLLDAEGALHRRRLDTLVASLAGYREGGREVVVVSSGAVAVGRGALAVRAFDPGPEAAAAVGQAMITAAYQRLFAHHEARCAQVLVGQHDLDDRERSVRLASTVETLLRQGAVPILNENDTVESGRSIETKVGSSRSFEDNDHLAALVAGLLGADLLVLLTDVEGVFDRDPQLHPTARVLPIYLEEMEVDARCATAGALGRGGMASKLSSARIAARGGCGVVVASGLAPGALSQVLAGETVGTWIPPSGSLAARSRWIAFSPVARGYLRIDQGAVEALERRGASLLARGATEVVGDFGVGDVIELRDLHDRVVARARCRYSSASISAWLAGDPTGITLIRRSDIVLGAGRTQ